MKAHPDEDKIIPVSTSATVSTRRVQHSVPTLRPTMEVYPDENVSLLVTPIFPAATTATNTATLQ